MNAPCEPDCECDGRCCALFYFPKTPAEIEAAIETDGAYNGNDGRMIAQMLVPLSREQIEERMERFDIPASMVTGDHSNMFTCKHWDEETKLCTVYENRPEMCAAYPYEKKNGCGYCGAEGGSKKWGGGYLAELGQE
jgi:Fe-S-cluster containining protein